MYVALDIDPGNATDVVPAFRTLGLAGANLTVPFKTAVVSQLDGLTPLAKAIGAVNTLYWDNGALCGDNTDAQGFVDGLVEAHGSLKGPQTAIVLGVGGAGRAVAAGLAAEGVAQIHLLNRTPHTASTVAEQFAEAYPRTTFHAHELNGTSFRSCATQATLVVNCVAGPGAEAIAGLPLAAVNPTAIWADLNYWMTDPPGFAALRNRGLRMVDGHGMLRHQAARAFHRWTGILPLGKNLG